MIALVETIGKTIVLCNKQIQSLQKLILNFEELITLSELQSYDFIISLIKSDVKIYEIGLELNNTLLICFSLIKVQNFIILKIEFILIGKNL